HSSGMYPLEAYCAAPSCGVGLEPEGLLAGVPLPEPPTGAVCEPGPGVVAAFDEVSEWPVAWVCGSPEDVSSTDSCWEEASTGTVSVCFPPVAARRAAWSCCTTVCFTGWLAVVTNLTLLRCVRITPAAARSPKTRLISNHRDFLFLAFIGHPANGVLVVTGLGRLLGCNDGIESGVPQITPRLYT